MVALGAYSGFTGDPSGFTAGMSNSLESQSKAENAMSELKGFINCVERGDALHMSWPHIAKKYASPPSQIDKIVVDIDASWGPHGPHDEFRLFNAGPGDIENCTVQVLLVGKGGESRKNVHFIRHWPVDSWVSAKYELGLEVLDRNDVCRTTVPNLSSAEVSVWSPQYTTMVKYQYQGEEKSKDVARWCQDLSIRGNFHSFEEGIIWDSQPYVDLYLEGVDSIPTYNLKVTFRNDKFTITPSYNDCDPWSRGDEKSFGISREKLTFEPSHIDVDLSFRGIDYRYRTTFEVK